MNKTLQDVTNVRKLYFCRIDLNVQLKTTLFRERLEINTSRDLNRSKNCRGTNVDIIRKIGHEQELRSSRFLSGSVQVARNQ